MNPAALLLVEDSANDAALIRAAAIPVVPPDQLVVTANGTDAIDYLLGRGAHAGRNAAESPRLVLVDLDLPGQAGLEVLRTIRATESTRLLPVIVLSASDAQEEVRTALQLGANSFVRKPADAGELARRIALLSRYWIELNIAPPAPVRAP